MKKCEPWAVAAVYLMQSVNGKAHYTNILTYILETELTELIEKNMATSRIVTEILRQKVIDGRTIFKSEGNGYYSLNDDNAVQKNEEIQGVIQSLKGKNLKVDVLPHEDKEKNLSQEDAILGGDNDTLSDEAMKLCEETRKLSDETRKLSDESRKLSDEVRKLSDENKKLREETRKRLEENQQLKEKLQSIRQLCE